MRSLEEIYADLDSVEADMDYIICNGSESDQYDLNCLRGEHDDLADELEEARR